jgi:hypothetical protein
MPARLAISTAIEAKGAPTMRPVQSSATAQFPQAGWLGARLQSWLIRKSKPRPPEGIAKQRASRAELEALRAKFAKTQS